MKTKKQIIRKTSETRVEYFRPGGHRPFRTLLHCNAGWIEKEGIGVWHAPDGFETWFKWKNEAVNAALNESNEPDFEIEYVDGGAL